MRIFGFKIGMDKPELEFYANLEELPIYNWHNLPEYGDYNLLLSNLKEINRYNKLSKDKNKVKLHSVETHSIFEEHYLKLMQEYIDRYGIQADTDMLFSYLKRKVNLQCDYVIYGKKSLLNEIKLLEVEILNLTPKETEKGVSLYDSIVGLEKFMKISIPAKKTSVVKYKSYFQLLEDYNKKNSNNNGG